jgi:serine protease Do
MVGFGEIAEQLRRSTVQVESGSGGGSGVIWTADGTIVTNSHVVSGDAANVVLWDGRKLRAGAESRDARRDLVKLRVPAAGLPAVQVRSSAEVRPGELVIAVGNPFGFIGAVTTGTVHATGRWIEASVRLAPGNSGGPLADARGRLFGINSMLANGVGLAVPSDVATRFVAREDPPPLLGVTVRPLNTSRGFGWLVLGIEPGSAAERASLLPGDFLLGEVEIDRGPVPIRFWRPGSDGLRQVTAVIDS